MTKIIIEENMKGELKIQNNEFGLLVSIDLSIDEKFINWRNKLFSAEDISEKGYKIV